MCLSLVLIFWRTLIHSLFFHPSARVTSNPLAISGFAYSGHYIQMESYNTWVLCLTYFTQNVFKVHLCGSIHQYFINFYCQIIVQVWIYHAMFESESEVRQLCPTLCNPMDCSLPGSSIHGIFQARVLEWVAMPFSRGSSRPRVRTQVSHIISRRLAV